MNKLSAKILVWHVAVMLFVWRLFVLKDSFQFNGATGFDINLPSFGWFLLTVAAIGLGYVLFSNEADHSHLIGGHRILSFTISLIVGLLFLVGFGYTWLNLLAVITFWLCNVWAQERALQDLRERMKINIRRAMATTLMPVVLGFFIIASFAAYQSNFAEKIKATDQLPSQTQVFFKDAVDKMFGSKLGPENSAQRKVAVNEVATGTFKGINDFLRPYFKWAPPVVAFGLFIILWGLSWIFIYAATLVAALMFWILKKTRAVRIEERDVKAEALVI